MTDGQVNGVLDLWREGKGIGLQINKLMDTLYNEGYGEEGLIGIGGT